MLAKAKFGQTSAFHPTLFTRARRQPSDSASNPPPSRLSEDVTSTDDIPSQPEGAYKTRPRFRIVAFMASQDGYGTLVNGSRHGGNESTDQEQPLLGGPRTKPSWHNYMMANVHRDWADVVLLICYTITGLLDSASISTWGSFVSMQTGPFWSKLFPSREASQHPLTEAYLGNSVYIGLGIASPNESKRWIKSGLSLASFCTGSFCFSRFHRYFMPRRRWVLCASFLAQMGLIAVAAAILTWGPAPVDVGDEISWRVLVPIALVAFQSCGQAVTSRALKYNSLTSVVLTSIYCDLFSDAELFALHNTERNRRIGAPVLLLVGVVMGGLLAHSSVGAAGALWVAAGLKLCLVLAWCAWRGTEN